MSQYNVYIKDADEAVRMVEEGTVELPWLTAMTEHIVTTHLGPLAAIAEAAREYVRIEYAMGDCSGNILPLLKAQSAAYDALVAAVEAERHP